MNDKSKPFIQVYCPELQAMISPGEWTMCPYFEGKKLDMSDTEDVINQVFKCHVQCGCRVEYQYYEGDKLVTKTQDSIEDYDMLKKIITLVSGKGEKYKKKTKKKVLLVDDDADFLEMHAAVLTHKGYEVITAGSSQECFDKLDKDLPDIVVLDVMMEHFDSGFKASQSIKKKHKNLPVMLLTSIGAQTGMEFSESSDVLELTGADVLLDKPVSPKVFIDEIEKLTSSKKG